MESLARKRSPIPHNLTWYWADLVYWSNWLHQSTADDKGGEKRKKFRCKLIFRNKLWNKNFAENDKDYIKIDLNCWLKRRTKQINCIQALDLREEVTGGVGGPMQRHPSDSERRFWSGCSYWIIHPAVPLSFSGLVAVFRRGGLQYQFSGDSRSFPAPVRGTRHWDRRENAMPLQSPRCQ